jgi:hypothetical protein
MTRGPRRAKPFRKIRILIPPGEADQNKCDPSRRPPPPGFWMTAPSSSGSSTVDTSLGLKHAYGPVVTIRRRIEGHRRASPRVTNSLHGGKTEVQAAPAPG